MPNYDPQRLAHWRVLIDEQALSGLSITAFCRLRHVHKSGFHRWNAVLRSLDSGTPVQPPRAQPKPLSKSSDTPRSAAFLSVRVLPDTLVELTLTNGM